MAKGSFTSPSGAPPKMKHGRVGPLSNPAIRQSARGSDPLRHASTKLPAFGSRHAKTNAKHGFHTKPARPPAGRLAKRPSSPNRGSGKEHRALL